MIRGFVSDNGRLRLVSDPMDRLDAVLWIDLLNPTDDEERALEHKLGVDIPTHEEMQAIEISSRLYQEGGAAFMTATLPARTDSDHFLMSPVTFVLAGDKLITVRYHEPRAFRTFPQRAEQVSLGCVSGQAILIALLEAAVDRIADVVERVQQDVDEISHEIFRTEIPEGGKRDLQAILQRIGRKGDLTSNLQDSLVSLQRLIGFFARLAANDGNAKDLRGRIRTVGRDIQALTGHALFLSQKIAFLLEATLGMVSIEQNNIIKIFTIAAGIFLPPTLIASIYGMNFTHMPELRWPLGYPLAVVAMVLSAVVPYWFFKRRGWL